MANHFSALKRARQTEKRTVRNRANTSRLRSALRQFRDAVTKGEKAAAGQVFRETVSALVIDQWRCILGICLVLTGYCLKAMKEEAMLSQQFGDAFQEHRKHTGFLIPRFR